MKTRTIVITAVLAASLWGSSDLMAQSKTPYRQPTYTPPARSTYQPLPIKRAPIFTETSRERWTRNSYNDWATRQNWRNR